MGLGFIYLLALIKKFRVECLGILKHTLTMGRAKQKERERKRTVASCQRLDKLFSSKRNKTVESESDILRQSDNYTPHSSDHSDFRTSTGNS